MRRAEVAPVAQQAPDLAGVVIVINSPGARVPGLAVPQHHTGRLQRHQPVIVILRDAVQGLEGGRSPLRP